MNKWILIALTVNALIGPAYGQGGGPPRRLENPETRSLPHGSRVEFLSFQSDAIGRESEYSVFLPPSYDSDPSRDYPVIYFLHGLWNDHTSWTVERYGSIPEQIENLMVSAEVPEFLIVQPDGENSFYTDYLDQTANFEELVYRDLIAEVETRFRVKKERRYRALGGVSMGGYGALKIAFRHPEVYASVGGFSPIVMLGEDPSQLILASDSRLARYLASSLEPVFGMPFDKAHWSKNSLENLARTASFGDLRIFFAYGTADRYAAAFPMEAGIRRLDEILTSRQAEHTFRVYQDGPHGWQLVADHLDEALRFLSSTF